MRGAWLVIVALLAIALAGCLGNLGIGACPPPGLATLTGPMTADGLVTRSPGQAAPILVRANNTAAFEASLLPPGDADDGEQSPLWVFFNPGTSMLPPGDALFADASMPPAPSGGEADNVSVAVGLHNTEQCHTQGTADATFVFEAPVNGEEILPGNGAMVHTAGFWRSNGTLFYTNMERVHEDARWPRAGWYEYEGGDALPVYIYNQSRDEMPPRYQDAGWVSTIEGFNEALRAAGEDSPHTTTGSIVANIPPEKAYTKPQYAGNQTSPPHDLYGDALVFYIEVADVVQEPCPLLMGPLCEAPDPPPFV